MSDISFCCPNCGHAYQFADNLGGKRGRCKACKEVFRVPVQAAPQSEFVKRPVPVSSPVSASTPAPPPSAPGASGQDHLQLPHLRSRLSARGATGREARPVYGLSRDLHDPGAVAIAACGHGRAGSRALEPGPGAGAIHRGACTEPGTGPAEVVCPEGTAVRLAFRSRTGRRRDDFHPHPEPRR